MASTEKAFNWDGIEQKLWKNLWKKVIIKWEGTLEEQKKELIKQTGKKFVGP